MIAFDAAYNGDTSGNANSLTYSHTTSGDNRILFVGAHTYVSGVGATGDIITGITYNSVAMTLIDKQMTTGGSYSRWHYLYYLIAPATGANNVVISASSASYRLLASSASYTGAKQTAQPDASSKATTDAVTSQALATTVVADDSWLVSSGVAVLDTIAAGTGVTLRTGGNTFTTKIGDSNADLAPGSNSMTWTTGVSSPFNVIQASFAPSIDSGGGSFLLNYL